MPDDNKTEEFDYERYAKYYDELPKEVVELLINTHPFKEAEQEEDGDTERNQILVKPEEKLDEEFKKAAPIKKEDLFDEDELEELAEIYDKKVLTKSFSFIRMISVAFFSILIMIIGFLTFSNSILSKKLEAANLLIDENKSLHDEYEALKFENLSLREQLEAPQNTVAESDPPVSGQESNDTVANTSQSVQTTSPAPGQTYTVLKGDNLWKIAKNAYGDGKHYHLILEANHLTSQDVIEEGMKITIPPLP